MKKTYCCSSCGAEYELEESKATSICPYCGSMEVAISKFDKEYLPEAIIPFKHKKEEIGQLISKQIRKLDIFSRNFENNKSIYSVEPLYIPFTVFTFIVNFSEDVTVRSDIEYIDIRRELVDKIVLPKDLCLEINDDLIASLEPFDFQELKEFNPSYLARNYFFF